MVEFVEKNDDELQKRLKAIQENLKGADIKELRKAYEDIYKDFPNDTRVLTTLGSILLNEHVFDKSIELLKNR